MKNLISSIAIAGLSAVGFTGSAFAVPIVSSGSVDTTCAIQNSLPGALGPNRTIPTELATQYSGGIPVTVNVLCNTTTSRLTIAPNLAASVLPPDHSIAYRFAASGNTGIYTNANIDKTLFKLPAVPSYTTPVAGAVTGRFGDIASLDVEIYGTTVIAPGNYKAVLDVTVTP